jgi:hypothetical protein
MPAGEGRRSVPLRGFAQLGLGPKRSLGRKVSPGLLFSLFFVSFSVFSFLLKLLQNSFKSTQTTSENFLEIHTTFLTQNNQVFKMKTRFLNKTF